MKSARNKSGFPSITCLFGRLPYFFYLLICTGLTSSLIYQKYILNIYIKEPFYIKEKVRNPLETDSIKSQISSKTSRIPRFSKNGKWREIKTEYNLYNEAYDDNNFDVQLKRQVRGVKLSSFRNDQSYTSSKKVFGIDIAEIHAGT